MVCFETRKTRVMVQDGANALKKSAAPGEATFAAAAAGAAGEQPLLQRRTKPLAPPTKRA